MRTIKFRAWTGDRYEFSVVAGVQGGFYLNPDALIVSEYSNDTVLEQYTGLNDKNGKEIVEGDMVKCEGICSPTEVFYDPNIRAWQPFAATHYPVRDWEVIGNIHENQDLLK